MIYPLEQLRLKGFDITGYFYNPNIHPVEEYSLRKEAVEHYSKEEKIPIILPEYVPSQYFQEVNIEEQDSGRCSLCWTFRLKAAALVAKEKGCTHFSTTLLVSPYQNHELIKKIGIALAEVEGIEFYYEDFRVGFRIAQDKAKKKGIYMQKHCGCVYSKKEQCKKLPKH